MLAPYQIRETALSGTHCKLLVFARKQRDYLIAINKLNRSKTSQPWQGCVGGPRRLMQATK